MFCVIASRRSLVSTLVCVTITNVASLFQGDEEKKGVRIIQGKPFLKRGPSNHSQSSFRRRSIRLAKADQVKRDSKRFAARRESDQECKWTIFLSLYVSSSSSSQGEKGKNKRKKRQRRSTNKQTNQQTVFVRTHQWLLFCFLSWKKSLEKKLLFFCHWQFVFFLSLLFF